MPRFRALWILPSLHVIASAASGIYYTRYLMNLAASATFGSAPPEPSLGMAVFWLFNLPALMATAALSGVVPNQWDLHNLYPYMLVQPVTLLACAVLDCGLWFWIGSRIDEPAERMTALRWLIAGAGLGLAIPITAASRLSTPQVIPYLFWPLLASVLAAAPLIGGRHRRLIKSYEA